MGLQTDNRSPKATSRQPPSGTQRHHPLFPSGPAPHRLCLWSLTCLTGPLAAPPPPSTSKPLSGPRPATYPPRSHAPVPPGPEGGLTQGQKPVTLERGARLQALQVGTGLGPGHTKAAAGGGPARHCDLSPVKPPRTPGLQNCDSSVCCKTPGLWSSVTGQRTLPADLVLTQT